jgi:TM2 domain-containing membrane protein YozV
MNCANHPDRERTAFCQNCGKPLCTECVRNVGNSVFCEPCLTAKVTGAPPAGYRYPGSPTGFPPPPVAVPGEPNPTIAFILGFIPGVGAMYNEQYAKGIVHLVVFTLLVSLASDVNGIFGLFIAGWEFYMAIEAHHTARARRDGTPLPNPFGLNDLSERLGFGRAWPGAYPTVDPAAKVTAPFAAADANAANPVPPANPYAPPTSYAYTPPVSNWGAPQDTASYAVPPVPPMPPVPPYPDPNLPQQHRFPSGAIWLIGLGLIFLVGNAPLFGFLHGHFLGPLLVIGVGVWIFVSKMTSTGQSIENDGTPLYHWRLMRAINCSVWVVLFGVIWLLNELRILSWSRSWPLYLIAAGVMMFVRRTMYPGYGYTPPATTPPPVAPVTTTEMIQTEPPHSQPGSNDQEGR